MKIRTSYPPSRIAVTYVWRGRALKEAVCKNPHVAAKLVEVRRDAGAVHYELHVTIKGTAPLGDLRDQVEITPISGDESGASAVDTPLFESLRRISSKIVSGAQTIPFMLVGATDARFFRRAGAVAYGYGLFSERISFTDYASMFHGDNERVDLESLDLVTRLWEGVLEDFLL